MTGPGPIDWPSAVRYGQKAAPSGPKLTPAEAAESVADLRRFSREAELAVREVTGMGLDLPVLDATVVDRPGWVAATAEGMEILSAPMVDRMAEKLREAAGKDGKPAKHQKAGLLGRSGARAGAAPVGMVLGYLSGKVLGQYDPFAAAPAAEGPGATGQLLLVAPNIVKVERELDADPQDFRLWVCVHESTHRLQFTAVPWLRGYFRDLVTEFGEAADLDPGQLFDRIRRTLTDRSSGTSWVEATQTPQQREVFDKLMALMSLLEGHADHVMDAVGPQVIPSVEQIRASFSERRRKGRGLWDRFVRGLLGMEMKMAQYVQGGAFVSAVVDQVGMAAFNRIWERPEHLPLRSEITEPAAWVARVLGEPAPTVG